MINNPPLPLRYRQRVFGRKCVRVSILLINLLGLWSLQYGNVAHAAYTPDVLNGVTVRDEILTRGNIQSIRAGGVTSNNVLSWGATQKVLGGGSSHATRLDGGVQVVSGGIASGTIVNSVGSQSVSSGGLALGTIINSGGKQYISSGGLASGAIVNSGGFVSINSGATDRKTTLNTGAIQSVVGTSFDATVNSGAQHRIYGSAVSATVKGGWQTVYGSAIATVIYDGGYQYVYGNAIGTVLSSALATSTIVNASGTQTISSGGLASSTTVNSGGGLNLLNGGSATDLQMNAGAIIRATIGEGLSAFASGTNESGSFSISGAFANAVILNSGAALLVSSGGVASNTTVNGGSQNIESAGLASGTTVNSGGALSVSTGGVASSTTVNNGGALYVSSGGQSWFTQINSGGNEYILSGGSGPSATIASGGTQTIFAGGFDTGSTIQAGGMQIVSGTAQSAAINGTQQILSGGIGIDGVVATGGQLSASSGSYLSAYVVSGSGATIVAAGFVQASSAGGLALAVSGNANSITLSSAVLGADIGVTGTGNTLSLQNGTTLSSGVSLIDSSNANTLALNNQSLTIASTPIAGATTVTGWNQLNLTNLASVNMAGNVTLAGANALLSIDATSLLSQSANTVIVAANMVRNAGTIALGASQTLTVLGNYQQIAGTLQEGFNGSSFGKMVVNGNALLSNAAFTLDPNSTPLSVGTRYKNVFSATGSTSGAFSSGVYRGVAYSLVADGLGFDLVTGATAVAKTTPTPLLNGAQSTVALNQAQATIQIVRDRMQKMGEAGEHTADSNSSFWATPFAYTARQSANGVAAAGYTQNTGGFVLGADQSIAPDLRIGGALILQNSALNGQDVQTQDKLTTTSYQFAAYAKQQITTATAFKAIVNAALDQNNASRLDSIGTPQKATASYQGWHGVVSGELDHQMAVGQSTITPLVRIDYGYVNVGAYSENGAGLSNLAVNRQTQSSTIGSVGAKYRYDINEANRILVRAIAGYDVSAKAASLTATDGAGTSFTSYGNRPGALVMQGGIGYEMQTNKNMRVRLNYDYMGRNGGYSNNLINASLIVPL